MAAQKKPAPKKSAKASTGADKTGEDTAREDTHRKVDPRLLEILVCPLTKTTLVYDREANELISEKAGLAFPIRDAIPIMLVEEARRLDEGNKGK